MKTIGIKIKEVVRGGFFSSGYITISVFTNDSGVESHIGDFLLTGDNEYRMRARLQRLKEKYTALGYEPIGQWD